jgi:hypothetical protein
MGQSNWLIAKKKKVGLVRHPKLINMKQNKCPRNKYPQFIIGVFAQASMGRPKHALGFFFFFSYFPGSQCVATMFGSSSQCVPQHVLHSTSFFSHMHHLAGPKGRNSLLQNRTFYSGGSLHSFIIFE